MPTHPWPGPLTLRRGLYVGVRRHSKPLVRLLADAAGSRMPKWYYGAASTLATTLAAILTAVAFVATKYRCNERPLCHRRH